MDPLAASGGQDRLSPYAAMGNQREFAVDPEGLLPNVFTKAGGGSVPEEGGPASSGWNMFGKGADMWYSSYMEFGGSGGGGSDGGASAASENAIPNTSSTSIYTMIGIAKSSPKGTANFNNENDGSEDKKYDIEGNINATNLPEKSSMEGIPVDQTAFGRGVNEFFIDISPGLGAVNMIKKYATGKSLLGNESSGMSPFEAIVPIIGRVEGRGLSVAEQAEKVSNEIGKNSITIKTIKGHIRYDLKGAPHGPIPTPHVLPYTRHIGPNGMINFKHPKLPDHMTQQDLRAVIKYIKSLTK